MSSLDAYRKKASFDVVALKNLVETAEVVEFRERIWETLANDPLFSKSSAELTCDEQQLLTFRRTKRVVEYEFVATEEYMQFPMRLYSMLQALYVADPCIPAEFFLSAQMFGSTILTGSNSEKLMDIAMATKNLEVIGCFALTELAHGSNSKGIKTTATYDPKKSQFILNTPDLEATKCWVGNLGKMATHALVYAQLYTPDGRCHGIHQFVVPVRDIHTLKPFPGIIVGDMGPKIGLNGLSNGFLSFIDYCIPKEYLLNKGGDVSLDGQYLTPYSDPGKRHGAMLGALSGGRVSIVWMAVQHLKLAVTISVRYSAVRRQFGPTPSEELPVLEYQLQRWRLFPYLAASIGLSHVAMTLFRDFAQYQFSLLSGGVVKAEQGPEIHALSCGCKSLAGFIAMSGTQESREACGGHGYLAANQFGWLRSNLDPMLTYEGDNNVILLQASNYLVGLFDDKQKGKAVKSPMGSVDVLDNYQLVLGKTFRPLSMKTLTYKDALEMFEWLFCDLWANSCRKVRAEMARTRNEFWAKENSLVYACHTLALVYAEHFILLRFSQLVDLAPEEKGLKSVLSNLCSLYGLWRLERHAAILYQDGYFTKPEHLRLVKSSILEYVDKLKDEAVALVDAIAPPDHILQSPIGMSNGEAYKNLYQAMITNPKSLERPSWWEEIVERPIPGCKHSQIMSKL